jgi:IS30 family transposase
MPLFFGGIIMGIYRHLSLDERKTVEELLNQSVSFTKIAKRIHRDKNTIAREVLRNSTAKRTGAVGQPFNNCKNRINCFQYRLCKKEDCRKQCCKGCSGCFRLCPEFEREKCERLTSFPYVCNGCGRRHKCTLEKFIYTAIEAHRAYEQNLMLSRSGLAVSSEEVFRLNSIISPLLKKGQSVHAILATHKDEIMLDEKTIYSYIRAGLFDAGVMDLLNAVKMRPRKKKADLKVERGCKDGRRYRDFLAYMDENPDTAIIQMDSVIGTVGVGEPVLLTIHFVEAELMLAFKREANTARSVTEVIESLYNLLGEKTFCELFPLILCDNGSEFSNPSAIEMSRDGVPRTKLFYTDPGAPYQKGACENNHSLIRRVIKKGVSLKQYSQEDINLLMNHINSYVRKKLKNRSPVEVFSFLHNPLVLEKLGIYQVSADDVMLNQSLLKK